MQSSYYTIFKKKKCEKFLEFIISQPLLVVFHNGDSTSETEIERGETKKKHAPAFLFSVLFSFFFLVICHCCLTLSSLYRFVVFVVVAVCCCVVDVAVYSVINHIGNDTRQDVWFI